MDYRNRLTHTRQNGIKDGYWSTCKKDELLQRLGQYEDTGLSPEEIKAMEKSGNNFLSSVISEGEFEKYMKDVEDMVKTWKKDGLSYLSRRQQLVDVIINIEDTNQVFTVNQLKQLFALVK